MGFSSLQHPSSAHPKADVKPGHRKCASEVLSSSPPIRTQAWMPTTLVGIKNEVKCFLSWTPKRLRGYLGDSAPMCFNSAYAHSWARYPFPRGLGTFPLSGFYCAREGNAVGRLHRMKYCRSHAGEGGELRIPVCGVKPHCGRC